jgi:hypothetical protein
VTMPVQLTQVPSRPSGCVRAVRRGRRLDVSYFSFPGPAAAAECADLRPRCIEWPAMGHGPPPHLHWHSESAAEARARGTAAIARGCSEAHEQPRRLPAGSGSRRGWVTSAATVLRS